MRSGCGISRKTNRKTATTFLYFWWYEDGQKHEKYLGRADDKNAELQGDSLLLSFYRKQDEELHRAINELVQRIKPREHIATEPQPPPTTHKAPPPPDYLPEMED
jgi:hypothetical protein